MDNTSAVLNEILSELKTLKSDVQTVKLNFKLMEEKLETIEKKLIQIQSTRNTPMVNDNARIDGSGSTVMSSDSSIKAPNPRRMSSSTGEFVAQQIELQEESTTKSTSSSNLVPLAASVSCQGDGLIFTPMFCADVAGNVIMPSYVNTSFHLKSIVLVVKNESDYYNSYNNNNNNNNNKANNSVNNLSRNNNTNNSSSNAPVYFMNMQNYIWHPGGQLIY